MIRRINKNDREVYLDLTERFYYTDVVDHVIPKNYREKTFDLLISGTPFADCFIFEFDGNPVGYALTANTFSQEAGGLVCWLEEIYVLPQYRGKGLGSEFFEFCKKEIEPDVSRLRLEIEPENEGAVRLYLRNGFDYMPYGQMYKEV